MDIHHIHAIPIIFANQRNTVMIKTINSNGQTLVYFVLTFDNALTIVEHTDIPVVEILDDGESHEIKYIGEVVKGGFYAIYMGVMPNKRGPKYKATGSLLNALEFMPEGSSMYYDGHASSITRYAQEFGRKVKTRKVLAIDPVTKDIDDILKITVMGISED